MISMPRPVLLPADRVVWMLRTPDPQVAHWQAADWDLLVRQARHADLMARVAHRLRACGRWNEVPQAPRTHFESALLLEAAQHAEVRREVRYLSEALDSLALPLVLLKGAAYVVAEMPPSVGRLFTDVDILVPRERLNEVEAALMLRGWAATLHSAYDDRYYREWMHELPPFEHMRRRTVVDVHHSILPLTARLKPDVAKLLAASQPVHGSEAIRVLARPDLLLHSMCHLFHNDEMSHGLRDLSDIDLLLREAGCVPGFLRVLVERAAELDLVRPLYHGLRMAQQVLGTPIPHVVLTEMARFGPVRPLARLMDVLWLRALRSQHVTAGQAFLAPALFLLYVRAHWLRMPPLLLARHLTIKALRLNQGPRQR